MNITAILKTYHWCIIILVHACSCLVNWCLEETRHGAADMCRTPAGQSGDLGVHHVQKSVITPKPLIYAGQATDLQWAVVARCCGNAGVTHAQKLTREVLQTDNCSNTCIKIFLLNCVGLFVLILFLESIVVE